jgi:glycosyltransferase involved in cell wall biosynthesis
MNQFSIVTVAMNRTEHLLQQARAVSMLHAHSEHIILDFGSATPISRDQLPSDNRIKLHRVESPNGRWWLTHAYNLAFALAKSDYILKLDADILISQEFVDNMLHRQAETGVHLMCNRLTLQDWHLPPEMFTTNGLFLCRRSTLAQLRGFNPYIQGWGWDEIDLYSRCFARGFLIASLFRNGVTIVDHDDSLRQPVLPRSSIRWRYLGADVVPMNSTLLKEVQNLANIFVARASVLSEISWPSFRCYLSEYSEHGALPPLPPLKLLTAAEKLVVVAKLLSLSFPGFRLLNHLWRRCAHLGLGPFDPVRAQALLMIYGIDLSLVG